MYPSLIASREVRLRPPSPRPSPPGRGRIVLRVVLDRSRQIGVGFFARTTPARQKPGSTLQFNRSVRSGSLSPGERARVRASVHPLSPPPSFRCAFRRRDANTIQTRADSRYAGGYSADCLVGSASIGRMDLHFRTSILRLINRPQVRQPAKQQTRQSALQPRVFAMIRLRIRRRLAGCVRVRFGHFNAVSLHA